MYLNIINNTVFENRRNKHSSLENKNNSKNVSSYDMEYSNFNYFDKYKSIFYGELTKNWISINNNS
ncbi:MAG: hypothetical protein CBE11_00725 [Rickettsiales bacterium TMED251]|nr:MAG: hypothetical protein CBE11_00725 [Rickettsiales bacterium TMED251]|tara:strand:+ start:284 stop:481 length:198 start_codon:yes stop_codon:yes gene_type:complete